eukprot:gene14554-biopygen15676
MVVAVTVIVAVAVWRRAPWHGLMRLKLRWCIGRWTLSMSDDDWSCMNMADTNEHVCLWPSMAHCGRSRLNSSDCDGIWLRLRSSGGAGSWRGVDLRCTERL